MTRLLLIVDLEATCWDGPVEGLARKQTVDDMEIIEFGCVLAKIDGEVLDSKSCMVRPQEHPVLSEFCTRLTSITQQDVEAAPFYSEAVRELDAWLAKYQLFAWGSWGNYDRNQIAAEKRRHQLTPGFFELPYMNLKQRWKANKVNRRNAGLTNAVRYHDLRFEGNQHRGIDDALNIARLLPYIPLD